MPRVVFLVSIDELYLSDCSILKVLPTVFRMLLGSLDNGTVTGITKTGVIGDDVIRADCIYPFDCHHQVDEIPTEIALSTMKRTLVLSDIKRIIVAVAT